MDNPDIVIREGAVNIRYYLVLRHFFKIRLNIREVKQFDGFFAVALMELLLGLVETIDQLKIKLVILVCVVFSLSSLL